MAEQKKEVTPTPKPEEKSDENPVLPVEENKESQEDTDFEKELEDLEAQETGEKPASKPQRSELDKAKFTAKKTLERIKELGGDPTEVLDEIEPPQPVEKPQVDTTQFVTKTDLARAEASKLAKSQSELKLIMWYVERKGMSVEDAHFMANKNRIKKLVGEVSRTNNAIPARAGGGPGERQPEKTDAPDLPEAEKRRLTASGMVYDSAKKAYIGKKVQLRYNEATKEWVTEKI